MVQRLHAFDGIENFRDFGGYATVGGGRVATGRLFRSGHHARATEADLGRLSELKLGAVADLRRPVERTDQPSLRCDGFDGEVIASDLDAVGEAPHITFLKSGRFSPDEARAFMTGLYEAMPFAPSHIETFGRYFRTLAAADRPVLIHCAAGKDRTGLLAALTHHLLGVSRDDLLDDYLLTNRAVDLQGRAPQIAVHIEKLSGVRPSSEAVVAFMGVDVAFLDRAFAAIVDRAGSIEAYVETVLGVDRATRDRLKARLVH